VVEEVREITLVIIKGGKINLGVITIKEVGTEFGYRRNKAGVNLVDRISQHRINLVIRNKDK
jgi:hypothetical protein